MGNPGRAGERAPDGADGSAGGRFRARRTGRSRVAPGVTALGYGWSVDATRGLNLPNKTYVSNVSYVGPDQVMINIRYLAFMPDDAIDPYADEPLYVQLAGIVRRMIDKGELQHLDPVPSESSLVQTYGVSRDTARRAMALLRDEGVVFTVPHRGTYVGPRPS